MSHLHYILSSEIHSLQGKALGAQPQGGVLAMNDTKAKQVIAQAERRLKEFEQGTLQHSQMQEEATARVIAQQKAERERTERLQKHEWTLRQAQTRMSELSAMLEREKRQALSLEAEIAALQETPIPVVTHKK